MDHEQLIMIRSFHKQNFFMKRYFLILLIPFLGLCISGCQKELNNPNAATGEAVLKSTDGLLGLVVGVKREYAVGPLGVYYNMVSANGLTTKELYVINTGNGELAALETGGTNVGGANSFVTNIFASNNALKAYAQLLIDNSGNAPDPEVAAYINGYGHFFKALAIGNMAQFFEKVPVEVVTGAQFLEGKRATFVDRNAALAEALKELDLVKVSTTVPGYFITKVGSDMDLINSTLALKARFAAMLGDWTKVSADAARVVTGTKGSVFSYDAVNQNPVFRTSLINNNTYNGLFNFGLTGALAPDSTDGRIAFYYSSNKAGAAKVSGFWKADDTAIPVYLPSEMILLQAEAAARTNTDLTVAVGFLNTVRTKAADPLFGVAAKGTAYAGPVEKDAILTEIYRQRCIELYMSGMKLEDSRRFGRPGPGQTGVERNRNFYPYPQKERDINPNTPPDPAI
jgi:starch-binding outer membrane protein, SusD/RagB family